MAQARAQIEGLHLATAVADAQELPFGDGSFDVVLSTFGAMFAPDQQRAAERAPAGLPAGGRIGLANWVPDGLMARNMVAFNRTWFGPVRTAFAQLDKAGQERLAGDLASSFEHFNRATDGTLVAEAEYLELVAVKA